MFKQVKKQLGLLALLALTSNVGFAAEVDIPSLNPDEGRIGEIRRVENDAEFRVCADPENMPFSNNKQEGFEDKIAQLLAQDLGKKLTLTLNDLIDSNRKPLVEKSSSFLKIIDEISSNMYGATAVVEDNVIIGVVTDGDIRRIIEKKQNIENY